MDDIYAAMMASGLAYDLMSDGMTPGEIDDLIDATSPLYYGVPYERLKRTIMQVIRINKRTGERTIATYTNDLSPEENLVSDILICKGMSGQLLNDSARDAVRRSLGRKGREYITGESQEYDHLVRK